MKKTVKQLDDYMWKSYINSLKPLEQAAKKMDHPLIKKSVKERIFDDLTVDLTEEYENAKYRGELS